MKAVKKFISMVLCCMMIAVMVTVMPFSASAANYSTNWQGYSTPTVTLKRGSSGNSVRWLQCAINDLIINGDKNGKKLSTSKLDVDGSFGPGVETAVKKFQSSYSLTADGCFGPGSRSKMLSVLKSGTSSCSHNWENFRVDKYPTCTTEGREVQKCSKCGNTRTVSIKKKAHTLKRTYEGGFAVDTCTVCKDDIYREDKVFVKKLMDEYGWSSYRAWCLVSDMQDYNRRNFTSTVKSQATQLGKTYSFASKVLKSDELKKISTACQNAATVCDYIDLACDLKTMVSGNCNNYDRMTATVNALSQLTSKVPCGSYYTSALDTISKGLNNTLNQVRKERITKILYDWACFDIKISGSSKSLQRMSVAELKANQTKVNEALKKRYKSLYGKTYEAALKNMSNEQYINMFMDVKQRQEISGTKNFADFVEKQLKVTK